MPDKMVLEMAAAREEHHQELRTFQVREPLYQFCAQTKSSWAFAIVATWILGSLMWQVMYVAERMAPGYLVPGTPGPNDFLSAVAGDFFALPAINGLIVLFTSGFAGCKSAARLQNAQLPQHRRRQADDCGSLHRCLDVGSDLHLLGCSPPCDLDFA